MQLEKTGLTIWKCVVLLASIITQVESTHLSGEQKKQTVIGEITAFLRPFNLPIPEFVLSTLLSPLIDLIVEHCNLEGLFQHSLQSE
ncbi:MAG TPA: hypothetical protein P5107_10195 [Thermotogota bacterium]|nr:hypothetical protein [Thermotogota bacterium]HRW35413.1 hypothetical protein [Thermotogota bacterium]